MTSDNPVSLWAVEGQGASGKSRLALELCNEYSKKGWKCGFYDKAIAEESLKDWEPEKDHLIVIDYVLRKEDESQRLIKHALQLVDEGNLHFRVRILLLDRDVKSTIEIIEQTPTFGEKIKAHFHSDSPLSLSSPSKDDIQKMIVDLAEYFELSAENQQRVMEYTLSSNSSRKILVAGLACLSLHKNASHIPENSLKDLVHGLIKRERGKFWRKMDFAQEEERYLITATIAGGIDRLSSNLGPEAKSFIDEFDFADAYGKVVGESATDRLAPLSHDVISELFVLESYDATKPAEEKSFANTIQICLQIDNGRGLVNFFTLAANDYPNHPTLNLLLPRFGQTEHLFTVWLLVISNIIDKIGIPLNEKLEIFNRTVLGLIRGSRDSVKIYFKLRYVFSGFFS